MKKLLIIFMSMMMCLVLFSCKDKDGDPDMKKSETKAEKTVSVTIINDVEEADFWIMPHTEENLKTSLWGTATVPKLKAGEKQTVSIGEAENGKYIIRAIDADKAYFSASDMVLGDNYTVYFTTDESKYEAEIETLDENSKKVSSKHAFRGVLGAN